jgi:hypothetical protein
MIFIILKHFLITQNKPRKLKILRFVTHVLPLMLGLLSVFNLNAQCKGVTLNSAVLTVVGRPCGKTATGSISLEIKGGLAPYTLAWSIDSVTKKELPESSPSKKLLIENLTGAMKPGYVVKVKDACGNKIISPPIKLLNGASIQFANPPQSKFDSVNNVDSTGSILVEILGGASPRTLIATDSKGHVYSQSIASASPGNAIFVYQLEKLPKEKYNIEIKSGTQNCSQLWKEPIELKPTEND